MGQHCKVFLPAYLLKFTNYSDDILWCGAVLSAEKRR